MVRTLSSYSTEELLTNIMSVATPFACTFSTHFPSLLAQLNCTLAISTYQAGKVIFLSAAGNDRLVQLPRTFNKPMGIGIDNNKLAIATQSDIEVFYNASRMAMNYPKQPNTYDALYLPRASYHTGEVDIHDLHWQHNTLWAVVTKFSCLATIDHAYSFTPQWKPSFITKISPEDHCHLNGVAFQDGQPKYVTALGSGNTFEEWRKNKASGGVVINVSTHEIIADGLCMPHSPRLYNDQLFILQSAAGTLSKINLPSGTIETVITLDGFVRGMDKIGDYLFIALSQLRKKSAAFHDLPIAKKSLFCGVVVIHLPTAQIAGHVKYENSVEEIYDVRILPNMRRPGLLSRQKADHKMALTTPDEDYWAILNEEADDKN